MGMSGYVSSLFGDMQEIGVGIRGRDMRSFSNWLAGNVEVLDPGEIAKAKALAKRFGLSPNFTVSPDSIGDFYIPRAAVQEMSDVMSQGLRQFGLQEDAAEGAGKTSAVVRAMASTVVGYYMAVLIFGGAVARQRYRLMSTTDTGLQMGMTVGLGAGAASMARSGALTLLTSVRTGGGMLDLERGADVVDKTLAVVRPGGTPKMFKAQLRKAAVEKGDEVGAAITRFFGVSKFRVEAQPILENIDTYYSIGERVYNARDLRRIFIRAGMYSSAYTDVKSVIRDGAKINPKNALKRTGASEANQKFVESAMEEVGDFTGRMNLRSTASSIFEHGLESADAWADMERTGAAVTLMEMGYNPLDAARIVVEALYDYRGSMTSVDRTLLRRVLMPFWAFRKNANIQFANFMGSPAGVFRVSALGRAVRFGPEALTSVIYEALVQPYDVNVTAMSLDERDAYYTLRKYFEYGEGDEVSQTKLDRYREMLPEDAGKISDEDLLDYDFNGWTVRDGFAGYQNVPTKFKVAFRGMLAGATQSRDHGRVYELTAALQDRELMRDYVIRGMADSVVDGQGTEGLAGWVVARKPVVQIPIPTLTEDIKETLKNGGMASLYFVLPDSSVTAALEHATAMLAVSYVLTTVGVKGWDAFRGNGMGPDKSDLVRLLNAFEPAMDIRGSASPIGKAAVQGLSAAAGGRMPKKRLHPIVARALEGSLQVPLPGGAQFNLPASWAAKVLGATTGDVQIDRRYAEARPVAVTVENGERVVTPIEVSLNEYPTPDGKGTYTPYLSGMSVIGFDSTFLGELNKQFLQSDPSGLETAITSEFLGNWALKVLAMYSRNAGIPVEQSDPERAASIDTPKKVMP